MSYPAYTEAEAIDPPIKDGKVYLSPANVQGLVKSMLAASLFNRVWRAGNHVYPIPRGGVMASPYLFGKGEGTGIVHCPNPAEAGLFFDDIIDTGATAHRYINQYDRHVIALIDRRPLTGLNRYVRYSANQSYIPSWVVDIHATEGAPWVVFPWEVEAGETGPEDNIIRILEYIGDDPTRDGLKETPKRVVASFQHLYGGYHQSPIDILKTFDKSDYDTEEQTDRLVILRDIEFYSNCEHHMQPFYGMADVAYVPGERIVGISKLARLVNLYSRRLQVQERMTNQIAMALMGEPLFARGAACIVSGKHMCMACRGVEKQHSTMITSDYLGVLQSGPMRDELMHLLKMR